MRWNTTPLQKTQIQKNLPFVGTLNMYIFYTVQFYPLVQYTDKYDLL